ncbi:RNA methyltransferase [Fibrobacterota bacterium]
MPLSIVLVNPEISQNVGFVARSMKCFTLRDLRIVGRKYPTQSLAYKTGSSAKDILDGASYYRSLPEALSHSHFALGFTCRRRDTSSQRIEKFCEVAPTLDFSLNTALVFGRESRGLSRGECLLMTRLVKIDLPNQSLSLNLSHAVTIALHEIFAHGIITGNPFIKAGVKKTRTEKAATHPDPLVPPLFMQREDTFGYLVELLHKKKVLKDEKARAHLEYLRRLWQRADPDQKELEFLMGLITKAAR